MTEILQHAPKPVGKYRNWWLAETFDFVMGLLVCCGHWFWVLLLFVLFLLGGQSGFSSCFPAPWYDCQLLILISPTALKRMIFIHFYFWCSHAPRTHCHAGCRPSGGAVSPGDLARLNMLHLHLTWMVLLWQCSAVSCLYCVWRIKKLWFIFHTERMACRYTNYNKHTQKNQITWAVLMCRHC